MDMTCKQLVEGLLRFRDGQLSEAETAHLREHLHLCPPCLALLKTYEEAVAVLERLRPVRMPPDLLDRLKARLSGS